MKALIIFSLLCAVTVGCTRQAPTEAERKPWDRKQAHRDALPPKAQGAIPQPPPSGPPRTDLTHGK